MVRIGYPSIGSTEGAMLKPGLCQRGFDIHSTLLEFLDNEPCPHIANRN